MSALRSLLPVTPMSMPPAESSPLKVAHVITRLIIGGAQENTLHTVEDQHHLHGDAVTLVTGPSTGPEGSLLPRAEQAGFPVVVLPELVRSIRPWQDWQAYRHLRKLFQQLKPDVIHTHSSKAGILGRAAAQGLNIPVVHTVHGASFHFGQSPWAYRSYVAMERWAARRTDAFICVADAMTQAYVEAGIAPAEKFHTIFSGFDVEPFLHPPRDPAAVRLEFGFQPQDIIVGKIGRLFHLKGHEFLIAAASEVVKLRPEVRFLFVGDGILREQFQDEIARQGLEKHFVFTGLVSPDRIPELMSAMDIVAHTSQWEGLARVLPQALISGKPVISYDVGGAREVVIPGETGYLLPRDSVTPLAEAILQLAADPDRRRRYGEAGRSRFQEMFRHQRMTEQIRAVYSQVLQAAARRSQKRPGN